jgi:hypothetical protein
VRQYGCVVRSVGMLLAFVLGGCTLLLPGRGSTSFGAGGIGAGTTEPMILDATPYELRWEVSDAQAPLDGCDYSIRLVADGGPRETAIGGPIAGDVAPAGGATASQSFQVEAGTYSFRIAGECAWDLRLTPIDGGR